MSKRVFNSKHRLDIVLALAELAADLIDTDRVVAASGIPKSTVHSEMQLLVEIGVLRRIEALHGGRTIYYSVADPSGAFWVFARSLAERALSLPGSSSREAVP